MIFVLPRFNENAMEYFQKDSIKIFNVRKVDITANYFGYPIGLPVARVSFQADESSCPAPLPFSSVTGITVSRNIAAKANSSLVEVDQNYSQDIMEKVNIGIGILLMPCLCDDFTNNNQTNVQNIIEIWFITLLNHLGSYLQGSACLNKVHRRGKHSSSKGGLLLWGWRGEGWKIFLQSPWRPGGQSHPGGDYHSAGHCPPHWAGRNSNHEMCEQWFKEEKDGFCWFFYWN